jgi:hypothetical protein|uniref:Uncharacterized protein n=1 Tax=viral metagenome TaxID=1070528 RepID=A0A6C0BQR7_9ZZZZ
MTLQDIWVDLKVISMLEPSRKLFFCDDGLALEPISYFSTIKRWLNNSNRRNVINRIKQRVEELERHFRSDEFTDNNWIKNEIIDILDKVKQGLLNLQETYTGDSQVKANIDLLIARLEYIRYISNSKDLQN